MICTRLLEGPVDWPRVFERSIGNLLLSSCEHGELSPQNQAMDTVACNTRGTLYNRHHAGEVETLSRIPSLLLTVAPFRSARLRVAPLRRAEARSAPLKKTPLRSVLLPLPHRLSVFVRSL